MKLVAIIVTLVGCVLMFTLKREKKAALIIMGAMTLTLVNVPWMPFQKANYLLQATFLLSEWKNIVHHLKFLWRATALKIPLLLVIVSSIICIFHSPHLNGSFSTIWDFIRSELLFKYFAICYAFWAYSRESSIKYTLRLSIYCLIVLTFLGIINYVTKSAMFVNAMTEGMTNIHKGDVALGEVYVTSERFRVLSMFKSPFNYGYICSAIFMLHLYGYIQGLEKKRQFWLAASCCFFGIIFCNCRIVWFSFFISQFCYILWSLRFSRAGLYVVLIAIALFFSYFVVPSVHEKVDLFFTVFDDESEARGSSIDMRLTQFDATLDYINGETILFGNGRGYFANDLGWGDVELVNQDLHGLESVIFGYLLERGVVGLVLWALFYLIILYYFWTSRKNYKKLSGLGASFVILYLLFSTGTGELGSVYPTMLLLGYVMKAIEKKKLRLKWRKDSPSSSQPIRQHSCPQHLIPLPCRHARTSPCM